MFRNYGSHRSTIIKPNLSTVVSVITATYNRSNVLFYAISSLLRSSFEDWEMIVIGDACTDDTQDVVTGFADSRIRYYNLAENFGDQSGPNNMGLSLARGDYIAYLNHDDLYFPDHLGTSLEFLEQTGADFVHSSALRCHPTGAPDTDFPVILKLSAVSDSQQYNPLAFVPASTWLARRELLKSVGPWRPATEVYGESSQDWLFRAWRQGAKMVFKPVPSVLIVPSGIREKAYTVRDDRDIKDFFEQTGDAHFREIQITKIANRSAAGIVTPRLSPLYHLRTLIRTFRSFTFRLLARFLVRFGIGPRALLWFLRLGWRRDLITHLNTLRGLPALDAKLQKSTVLKVEPLHEETSSSTEVP